MMMELLLVISPRKQIQLPQHIKLLTRKLPFPRKLPVDLLHHFGIWHNVCLPAYLRPQGARRDPLIIGMIDPEIF